MSATSQAYLNTRVSVMSTRLLGAAQLRALAQLSLAELGERIGLRALSDDQLSKRAKGRAAEQALTRVLMEELTLLIRPMPAAERGLLLAWARKFALFNLKTFIRGKLHQLDQTEIRENLYDLPVRVRLASHDELLRAENVLELLRTLEQGSYRLIARQAREVFEKKRDLFALEASIDQRYFAELIRHVDQCKVEHRNSLRKLLGVTLDRVSLLWLLRFRFAYGLSPSETFYQLVPSPNLLRRDQLMQLANLATMEQVLEALPPPLDTLLAGSTGLIDVERRVDTYHTERTRRILAGSTSGVARALAYLLLRESDLMALFSLLQGRLMALPQEWVEIGIQLAEPNCAIGSVVRP